MNIYALHEKMTAHLFPAYSSTDERFLILALCGEAAELAEAVDSNKTPELTLTLSGKEAVESIKDEIADCRVYLELIAKCFDFEGDKLLFDSRMCTNIDNDDVEKMSRDLMLECGLLANSIKKRWRDGADLKDECQQDIMMIRQIIEMLAVEYGIGGDMLDQRVVQKLEKVAEKHKGRLT